MYIVKALSNKGKEWINENMIYESWQIIMGGIAVDHHSIEDIAYGIKDAGLNQNDMEIIHV